MGAWRPTAADADVAPAAAAATAAAVAATTSAFRVLRMLGDPLGVGVRLALARALCRADGYRLATNTFRSSGVFSHGVGRGRLSAAGAAPDHAVMPACPASVPGRGPTAEATVAGQAQVRVKRPVAASSPAPAAGVMHIALASSGLTEPASSPKRISS